MIHLAAHISKLLYTSPSPLQIYLFLDNTITLHLLHHTLHTIHLSHILIFWNFTYFAAKYTFSHFPISLTKPLFIDNNITHILQHTIIHYPYFSHSIILKLHHFYCSKYIFISFFTIFNLHIIYLTFPYILQIHSSQNTHTYFSYIFKLHVSQSIHIQDLCPTKYLHVIPIHITNIISHNIYIYIYFLPSLHILKYIKIFFQEHITKAISYGRHKFIMLKVLLMEGKNL